MNLFFIGFIAAISKKIQNCNHNNKQFAMIEISQVIDHQTEISQQNIK